MEESPRMWRQLLRVVGRAERDTAVWAVCPGWNSEVALLVRRETLEAESPGVFERLVAGVYFHAQVSLGVDDPRQFVVAGPVEVAKRPDPDDGLEDGEGWMSDEELLSLLARYNPGEPGPPSQAEIDRRISRLRALGGAETNGNDGSARDSDPAAAVRQRVTQTLGAVIHQLTTGEASDLLEDDANLSHDYLGAAQRDLRFVVEQLRGLHDWLTGAATVPPPTLVGFDPIHGWFELTYAQYLTLPRSVLQSMPTLWQADFVRLLRILDDTIDWRPKNGEQYRVTLHRPREEYADQDDPDLYWGPERDDPLADYQRGRRRIAHRGEVVGD